MAADRTKENKKWRQVVLEDVECEGFFEAIFCYDTYHWVDDAEFQRLKKELETAAENMSNYLGCSVY